MGEWRATMTSYLTVSMVICELGGRLVNRRYWKEKIEVSKPVFCNLDHVACDGSYRLPLSGKAASR